MVYTNLKNTAISLRKEGRSYSEIKTRVPVSKSTLSNWFKNIRLSPVQRARLKQKRAEAAKRGSEKKVAQTLRAIAAIQKNSSKDVGRLSKRELWLMGVMLYWKNGYKKDPKKGVHFSSSDPSLIRFFLKWLREVGQLKDEEIAFDIFTRAGKKGEVVDYWSRETGFSEESFLRVYFYNNDLSQFGFLRIRVKASSMLARQIAGWIKGIKP